MKSCLRSCCRQQEDKPQSGKNIHLRSEGLQPEEGSCLFGLQGSPEAWGLGVRMDNRTAHLWELDLAVYLTSPSPSHGYWDSKQHWMSVTVKTLHRKEVLFQRWLLAWRCKGHQYTSLTTHTHTSGSSGERRDTGKHWDVYFWEDTLEKVQTPLKIHGGVKGGNLLTGVMRMISFSGFKNFKP